MGIQLIPLSEENLQVKGEGISYDPNKIGFAQVHLMNMSENHNIDDFDRITLYKYYSFDSLKYVLQDQKLYIKRLVVGMINMRTSF